MAATGPVRSAIQPPSMDRPCCDQNLTVMAIATTTGLRCCSRVR